jgi:hypothetical protein
MKIAILVCLLVLGIQASPASAQFAKFNGEWKNSDPKTLGIKRLEITGSATDTRVHAWGSCHPTDCDLGEAKAVVYGKEVGSDLSKEAAAIVVEFKSGFSTTLMVIKQEPDGKLSAELFDSFSDGSKRSSYYSIDTFVRK